MIVAVADIEHAAAAYGQGFGLMVDPIAEDRARGVAVAHCHPPKGGVIELVSVRDESRPFAATITRHLREDREGMYALVLESPDLQATAASLRGHGVGARFHEEPQVLHYGRPGTLEELVPGMIFTIEPMINAGRRDIKEDRRGGHYDGWTIVTKDRSLSAQWEHTVLVTDSGYEVLTLSAGMAL